MDTKNIYIVILAIVLLVPAVISNDLDPIPADKTQVHEWFQKNVQQFSSRKSTLDPNLVNAEENFKVIKVSQDGKGDFTSITNAVQSIPYNNSQRIIVAIYGGTYTEKINVTQSYITFYGSPASMPTLVFNGIAKNYRSYYCGTLTVTGDYFVAANIIFKNSSPRPDPARDDEQGVAVGMLGKKAAFYHSKFFGFQDTLLDEGYGHFYKDCYIEGTVDFIFGRGKSIFLNTELHVVPGNLGNPSNVITSHFRDSSSSDEAYSFVHCSVTGSGGDALLGRALMPCATVVYSYTELSSVINPQGWLAADNKFYSTVFFREYKNSGDGSSTTGRVSYSKELSDNEATTFLTLSFIQGSTWLLPPPACKRNSAPRPDPAKIGGQAVALGITGQKAAIYNSKIFGYQDTLLDEGREHFYKDCYIERTVDFIFGRKKTIFLNNELHVVVPANVGFQANVITSHSRNTSSADEGYSFVHCFVTGTGGNSILGRALFAYASVVYSHTDISDVLDPLGWARNNNFASTVFFREYKNSGARAGPAGRVPYSKQLSDAEVKPFLSLSYIQGSKWLLPPPTL